MKLYLCLLFLVGQMSVLGDITSPVIRNGKWNAPFMYWRGPFAPALLDAGSSVFFCEVTELGEDTTPKSFKSGTLKLVELLSGDKKLFAGLDEIDTQGCDRLKIGDKIIFIAATKRWKNEEDHIFALFYRTTNCSIGHRLTRPDEEGYNKATNNTLVSLARRGFPPISELTANELSAFSTMDPDGVRALQAREDATSADK